MSFTTRHWNDCYDERYCSGKTCGHSCHCKYDDVFSIGSLSTEKYDGPPFEPRAPQIGIIGTIIATTFLLASMSDEERAEHIVKIIAKEETHTKGTLQAMLEEIKNIKPFMDANHITERMI